MEQQTVTIAKAGIHASLNARCSVLAAANPVYGQYHKARTVQENVGLPDSLLSRFDLLFVVLDQIDPGTDRAIAEHVIRAHSYRRPGTDMAPERLSSGPLDLSSSLEDDKDSLEEHRVWEDVNPLVARGERERGRGEPASEEEDILTKNFLRKYIFYAKSRIQPRLTSEAEDAIANYYSTLRSKQERRTVPITPRTLETLIRLSTAHAKVRLSNEITRDDCERAMELLAFALYHEGNEPPGRLPPSVRLTEEEEEEGEGGGEEGKGGSNGRPRRRRRADRASGMSEGTDEEEDEEEGEDEGASPHKGAGKKPRSRAPKEGQAPGKEEEVRESFFLSRLSAALQSHGDGLPLAQFVEILNEGLEGREGMPAFSEKEVLARVVAEDENGKCFWEDNAQVIYTS
ncbi:dna replication licensing factor mcm3 [Nannochloropsis gaditana]|uniref:DNA replication licensing factor MCM3 n=1 Tax=Nannochloropsis gaditana TaxID=72520 RepID=W7U2X0_9STRA|nr:dna replication licensing factor mcm3 [Nannochloropsis gaditana]